MSEDPQNKTELLKGHRERLRARLAREPLSVADYEVVELLLCLVVPRKDTKPLALELMRRFKNIRGVIDARPDELARVPGVGDASLALWRLLRETMARYTAAPLLQKEVMASPEAVAAMARQRLGNLPEEESWLGLVDAQNRLIYWERLRRGGVSSVAMEPRDALEIALLQKASGLFLIHNHPGGSPYPSKADLELTAELGKLAPRLGLRLLDHIIVTAGDCFSIIANRVLRYREEK